MTVPICPEFRAVLPRCCPMIIPGSHFFPIVPSHEFSRFLPRMPWGATRLTRRQRRRRSWPLVGTGANAAPTEVRAAAAQALIRVADLSEVALQATHADQRRDIPSLLRQIGPEATEARRALQSLWERGQPALGGSLPLLPSQLAAGDLSAERLAALESILARIEKGMKASQAASPAASPEKRLYTVEEVAELVKLSAWTVRNACTKGRIKAEKGPNRQWRIPR